MTPFTAKCSVCENLNNNRLLKVKEMYFGTREEFDYLECSSCGCLQLVNPPDDYSVHYPGTYFTYQQKHESKLKSFFNYFRDRAALGNRTLIGNFLLKWFGEPAYIKRMKIAGAGFSDSILDVGCGKGILLHKMKESGFENLLGTDPFIENTITYKNGLKILKKEFEELEERFDLIMFNHSFEHMNNPQKVLKHANKILKPGKTLLLRIPVADCYAFRTYKENWCSLDAPRHLFLHTKKSVNILAEKCGFEIYKTDYDSRSWQLWGSEQYSKNIPLMDPGSYYVNPSKSIFIAEQIKEFESITTELNKIGDGDQAEFYLKKISDITSA